MFWQWKALGVKNQVLHPFLVTCACQSTQANISLLSICNRHSMRLLFWHLGLHLGIIWFKKYNLDLPWVISFLLIPHLPKLVTWQRRKFVADRQTQCKFIYGYIDFFVCLHLCVNWCLCAIHKICKKKDIVRNRNPKNVFLSAWCFYRQRDVVSRGQ